jgi:hypothetical protein
MKFSTFRNDVIARIIIRKRTVRDASASVCEAFCGEFLHLKKKLAVIQGVSN